MTYPYVKATSQDVYMQKQTMVVIIMEAVWAENPKQTRRIFSRNCRDNYNY